MINPSFWLANHKLEGGFFIAQKRITCINATDAGWKDCLNRFLLFKKAQGLAELTLNDYERHIKTFFSKYNADLSLPERLQESVYDFLSQSDIKPATYNNRLVYLRAFFRWCVDEGIINKNPLKHLLEMPDKRTFAGLRDYARATLRHLTAHFPPLRFGEVLGRPEN
ncbi:site-specific integrase [Paenibacillus sp. 32O-W]|uniref:site-specific integrase n=1 Tax=Paenibacillus sp. 32O-W TaxID=1695218 RepID=UPI000780BD3C|nr:site-specific integrase [Paenibacillus sp. 32O-W]